MAQPGRNFSKTYHTPFEPKFHVDYKNLLGGGGGVGGGGGGRKIMAINTNIGRTSKSHKRLKNLIHFLSEIIGLQYSLLNSRFPCFEIKTNVYVNVYVYISVW